MPAAFRNFGVVSIQNPDPKTMANGISEALVTTMLGLMTAIPATFMAAIMANYAKNILTVLEEQSTGMVAAASEENKTS